MKKKIFLYVIFPLLLLALSLGIGTFIKSKADSQAFVVTNGCLTKYSGSDEIVTIPSNVKAIGNEAFANNPFVNKVIIPDGVKEIGSRAFLKCTNLEEVELPSSITSLGDSTFSECSKLNKVILGSGLNKIGSGVFADCDSLSYIFSNSPKFICKDGALYNDDETRLVQYLAGYPRNVYVLPSSIEDIDRYSFWGADNLEKIDLSGSLTKIPDYAVANCKNLQDVVISTPNREISPYAFQGDSSLKQVVMPISVSNISPNSFDSCPEDIVFVCDNNSYSQKFAEDNHYLTSDYPLIDIVDNNLVLNNDLLNISSSMNDLNPYSGVDEFFSESTNDVSGNSSYNSVDDLYNNSNYVDTSPITYPPLDDDNASRIVSDRVFLPSSNLNVVSHSDENYEEVSNGNYVFYDSDVNEFFIDEDINTLGNFCYARSSLTNAEIPEGVKAIGYGAFYHCDNLENVSIPSTVNFVGEHAFDYTPWFENWKNDTDSSDFLIVGDGVLIGYKGESLTKDEANLPDEVKTVAEGVFQQ